MNKISQQIRGCILHFSIQERRKRKYACFEKEILRLKNLPDLELKLEYIEIKDAYVRHKNVLSLFLVSIVLAVFMNAWKYFFDFINQLLKLTISTQSDSTEIAKVGFYISAILVTAITATVLLLLIAGIRKSSRLYRSLLMIEEAKKDRK